jgi:hypothetical protein
MTFPSRQGHIPRPQFITRREAAHQVDLLRKNTIPTITFGFLDGLGAPLPWILIDSHDRPDLAHLPRVLQLELGRCWSGWSTLLPFAGPPELARVTIDIQAPVESEFAICLEFPRHCDLLLAAYHFGGLAVRFVDQAGGLDLEFNRRDATLLGLVNALATWKAITRQNGGVR